MFFVYIHSKPDDTPFYVGKGNSERIKYVDRSCNRYHTRTVRKYGSKNIKVRVYPCDSEAQSFELERELISLLRNHLGIKLCNMTDGGEGASGLKHSLEHILSRTSPEVRAKAASTLKARREQGLIHPGSSGMEHSDVRLAEIAQASLRMHAQRPDEKRVEINLKISLANTGKTHSDETKEKLRQLKLGTKQSEETKEKRAESHRGRKNTEETKLLMAAKAKAREEKKRLERELRIAPIHPNKGRVYTEEQKLKMSETAKRVASERKAKKEQSQNESLA